MDGFSPAGGFSTTGIEIQDKRPIRRRRMLVLLALSVTAGILAAVWMPKPLPELSRAELLDEVRNGHVHKITIQDKAVIDGESTTRGRFRSPYHRDEAAFVNYLRQPGVEVEFEESDPGLIP